MRAAILAAAALLLAGCPRSRTMTPEQTLSEHKAICEGKGEFIAATRPCLEAERELAELVRTDPDCRAYWGDAGVMLKCGLNAFGPDGGAR